jgi:MYXO-CTERM domain-containing protein
MYKRRGGFSPPVSVRAAWLVALVLAGCGARGPADEALRTGAHDPALAQALARNPGAWSKGGGGWQSPGWRAGPGASLLAAAPLAADGILDVGVGGNARRHLSMRLDGARPVPAIDDGGRLVYADAFPSTEVLFSGARARIEAFFLLRDAAAPTTFRWTVQLPEGLPRARTIDGGVEFLDENGRASVRVGPAYAIDASGRRRDAALAYADGKLEVRLDPTGLRYPILLDPPIEVANWTRVSDGQPMGAQGAIYDSQGARILLPSVGKLWSWNGSWHQLSAFIGYLYADEGAGKLLALSSGSSGTTYNTWLGDGVTWTQQLVTGPTTGANEHIVWDSTRSRAVLVVGGSSMTDPFLTWEWDGTKWTQIMIAGPPPRAQYAMTFDSKRGRTVLFGGEVRVGMTITLNYFNDTWEYDGVSWTQRCTNAPCKNTVPVARSMMGLTFDGARARTVMFGGQSSSGTNTYYGDTWEWDGSVWSQRATTGPPPRAPGALTYDAALGASVMYGNFNCNDNQLWTWNGTTWTQPPPNAPSMRHDPAVVYDSNRQVTVVFGGFTSSSGPITNSALQDTWEWNGSAWSLRATTGPSVRSGSSAAFDSKRNRTVVYGGRDNSANPLDDTWEWDGSSWTNPATTGPGARSYAAATFDPVRARVLLFGGKTTTDQGDTWEWDGATWSLRASSGPPAREAAGLVYDPLLASSVLMGGSQSGTNLNDTWTWNGSAWSPVATATLTARNQPGLVWNTIRKELVAFGGSGSGGTLGDTLVGDGTSWQGLAATIPEPRTGFGMVYDQARGRALVFGGSGGGILERADLWSLELSGGGCSVDNDCETGHCVDGTCCNVASCGTCQTCNGTAPGTCTAVTNADDADTCTGINTCDAGGACKLKAGQSCGTNGTVCASAFCADGVCCNAACTNSCQVCAKSLGATADGTCTTAAPGFAGRPACTAVLCNGNVATCPANSCNGDAQCAPGYFCAGNATCQPVRSQGMACNSAAAPTGDCLQAGCRECNSPGGCVDGFCCAGSCALGCEACDQTPGICTVAPAGRSTRCVSYVCDGVATMCPTSCTSDAQCATGYHCVSGACTAASGQGLGQTCSGDAQCLSGHCVDGTCCDSACVGACNYCDGSGHCQAAAPGTDPRGACAGEAGCAHGCTAAGTCDFPGASTRCDVCKACDGTGRCNQPLADDSTCGAISCAGLSTECAQYADVTAMRCVALGVCATANDPAVCTTMTPVADGTACSTGMCANGRCVAPVDAGTGGLGLANGCDYGGAAPASPLVLGLVLLGLLALRRRRAR